MPRAGAIDRGLRDLVHREHVIAVGLHAGHAVRRGLVHQVRDGGLLPGGGRVGVAVVLADDDERQPLHRGEVHAFVEGAGAHGAVADVDQAHPGLAPRLEGEGDAGHDRHHVAQVRDLAEEPALEIVEMDVELAAGGRASVPLAMYWRSTSTGRRPLHQHRAEVPDQRREDVAAAPVEGVGAPDRVGLLAQRAEEPADHLGLPVEVHQPLFERAGEPHVVVELEQLLPIESARNGVGERLRPCIVMATGSRR